MRAYSFPSTNYVGNDNMTVNDADVTKYTPFEPPGEYSEPNVYLGQSTTHEHPPQIWGLQSTEVRNSITGLTDTMGRDSWYLRLMPMVAIADERIHTNSLTFVEM